MIVPPVTRLPSCAFTPRRCELESRPLRELPCPFLCAIAESLDDDVRDADARVDRAVAFGPAHALPALLLEHADLRPARLALDDGVNLGVRDVRRTGENLAAVLLDEQDLFERDGGPWLGDRASDERESARRNLHLVARGLD